MPDKAGRIVPQGKDFDLPHYQVIERAEQVQVYELVALDKAGKTTQLSAMATQAKDSRLLPRGWSRKAARRASHRPSRRRRGRRFHGRRGLGLVRPGDPRRSAPGGQGPVVSARLLFQTIPRLG
ncbi:MAG: hypothetical protein R3F17_12520 [Planctomycetota bacterium]